MAKLLSWSKGRKTYGVSLLMLLFSFLGYFLGELQPVEAGQLLLEALGLAGLRAGVAKR